MVELHSEHLGACISRYHPKGKALPAVCESCLAFSILDAFAVALG